MNKKNKRTNPQKASNNRNRNHHLVVNTIYNDEKKVTWLSRFKKGINLFWGIVVVISTGIGFLAFKPEISFNPLNDTNEKNAFSTQFEIHNESFFSITDISYICHVDSIYFGNNNRIRGINFKLIKEPIPEIGSKEFQTEDFKFRCILKGTALDTLKYADVYFMLDYTYLGFTLKKRFRVKGKLISERFVWTKQPDLIKNDNVLKNATLTGRCNSSTK